MGIWRGVSVAPPKARPSADLRANASAAMAAVLFGASVVVDLGAVPPDAHAGRGLREPEPDRGRPARSPASRGTAQRHVPARLRGGRHRGAARQLARRPACRRWVLADIPLV